MLILFKYFIPLTCLKIILLKFWRVKLVISWKTLANKEKKFDEYISELDAKISNLSQAEFAQVDLHNTKIYKKFLKDGFQNDALTYAF